MPISPRDLEAAITGKLGFVKDPAHTDHVWYRLELPGVPTISTMRSHSRKDIGKRLESNIARQMRITAPMLRDIVKCTVSRSDYVAAVRKR